MSAALALDAGWQLARAAPDAVVEPAQLAAASLQWVDALVPGTVASALQADCESPGPYDAHDWWYRVRFRAEPAASGARQYLCLGGLATLAQAWLNGRLVLESRNMFVEHRIDVTGIVHADNELAIRFASLDAALAKKRPRGRWRTALVAHQGLRWIRTTLMGRIPGWTPPIAVVGPWGPVFLERVERVEVTRFKLRAQASGKIEVALHAATLSEAPIEQARLRVGEAVHRLPITAGTQVAWHGEVQVEGVPTWWPHTHGEPRLADCTLEVSAGGEWIAVGCARVGFRDVALDTTNGRVQLLVNGVPVFCRGAVWTPLDMRTLRAPAAQVRAALELARDAGINMLRVGGTMVYEQDEFYRTCDELGILVWQDFMFANMDYPVGDPAFRAEVVAEARQQVERLSRRACVAVYCGGSEVAQQAAMMGLPAEQWSNDFFGEELPRLCAEASPGIPYFPSTPWGGALPFHVGTGISHYYGVGAYRRPLADAKTAHVRFTSECLGFSNVPDRPTMDLLLGGLTPPPHHPRWKARVPRDSGSGWDFEDIRDHYLGLLFSCDPVALRSEDLERYYAVSRVVTGEVMRRTFAEWRSPANGCGGALVWFLRDLWPGAGWGIVDSTGRPKAACWYLRRAWATRSVHVTDEGLDGLAIHVVNEQAQALRAAVEIEMYRHGRDLIASARAEVEVPARQSVSMLADAVLGRFTDSTHAYRFGAPKQDVVAVRLVEAAGGAVLAEDFHFPVGYDLPMQRDTPQCRVEWQSAGTVALTVSSEAFLQSVALACKGWLPDDNYFHVAPRREKRVTFTPTGETRAFRAELEALNAPDVVPLRADPPA